jgi:hypothetical protein
MRPWAFFSVRTVSPKLSATVDGSTSSGSGKSRDWNVHIASAAPLLSGLVRRSQALKISRFAKTVGLCYTFMEMPHP